MKISLFGVGALATLLSIAGCYDLPYPGGGTIGVGGGSWSTGSGVGGRVTNPPPTGGAGGGTSIGANPVKWITPSVSLTADDFSIEVDGKQYLANAAKVNVSSDPGNSGYTSLELRWTEHARQMRLFMYFYSDGKEWWSDEIRTYDGQEGPEWLYYFGDFFTKPVNTPYVGDLVLENNGPDDAYDGTITFRNLRLLPTFAGK